MYKRFQLGLNYFLGGFTEENWRNLIEHEMKPNHFIKKPSTQQIEIAVSIRALDYMFRPRVLIHVFKNIRLFTFSPDAPSNTLKKFTPFIHTFTRFHSEEVRARSARKFWKPSGTCLKIYSLIEIRAPNVAIYAPKNVRQFRSTE